MAVAARIVKEEGFLRGLYEGFSFVLARQVLGFTLLYSALICFTSFVLARQTLCFTLLYCLYSTLLCITRLNSALPGFTLLYSALLCVNLL